MAELNRTQQPSHLRRWREAPKKEQEPTSTKKAFRTRYPLLGLIWLAFFLFWILLGLSHLSLLKGSVSSSSDVVWVVKEEEGRMAANTRSQRSRGMSALRVDKDTNFSANFQFPSVEERIVYYLGDWTEESGGDDVINCKSIVRQADLSKLRPFKESLWHLNELSKMTGQPRVSYGVQAKSMMELAGGFDRALFKFGDVLGAEDKNLPVITKSRRARWMSGTRNILWPLAMERHYGPVSRMQEKNQRAGSSVVPWEDKVDTLLWRGYDMDPTEREEVVTKWFNYDISVIDVAFVLDEDPEDVIEWLTSNGNPAFDMRPFARPYMSIEDMLKYKYLLSIEGNDVATNLKWLLYSNSVVFMRVPRVVTYAMEDLLVPFVHYIPIADDYSNLAHMVAWARDNDERCQWIAKMATEYVERLWVSEQAQADYWQIRKRLAKTYRDVYVPKLRACEEKQSKGEEHNALLGQSKGKEVVVRSANQLLVKTVGEPRTASSLAPHIDRETRRFLDIKPFFRGDAVRSSASAVSGGLILSSIITLVTQISVHPTKLQRLADLASRWDGFVSVAVYVRTSSNGSTRGELRSFLEERHALFNQTVIHLVTDMRAKDHDIAYPINILRNVAMERAPTNRVMLLDADFIPSLNAHSQLKKHLSSAAVSGEQTVLILPAFERRLKKGEDETSSFKSFNLPSRKADLLSAMERDPNAYTPFQKKFCSSCHAPTNFDKWYTANHTYPVEYAYKFEPYFVISKDARLPPFWEFFTGFGFNKWSWVAEVSFAGYTFTVAPDCFLVHINHKFGNQFRSNRPEMVEELALRFDKHLRETYGSESIFSASRYYWVQLPERLKAAARILGFNEMAWDEDEDIPAYAKSSLDPDEVKAIELLGLQKYFQGFSASKLLPPKTSADTSAHDPLNKAIDYSLHSNREENHVTYSSKEADNEGSEAIEYGGVVSWKLFRREEVDGYWIDLPDEAKAAAALLGFDEKTWDADEEIPLYEKAIHDLTEEEYQAAVSLRLEEMFTPRYWKDLPEKEKAAATLLGHDQISWDFHQHIPLASSRYKKMNHTTLVTTNFFDSRRFVDGSNSQSDIQSGSVSRDLDRAAAMIRSVPLYTRNTNQDMGVRKWNDISSGLDRQRVTNESIYLSGVGEDWERVYFRANTSLVDTTTNCPNPGTSHRAIPEFSNGVAAGPRICHNKPSKNCSSLDYFELDVIKLLSQGKAIRIFMPTYQYYGPLTNKHALMDRVRESGVSCMVFLDTEHFIATVWAAMEIYLYRFDIKSKEAELLQRMRLATGITPEPLDYDDVTGLLIVGIFRKGSQYLFSVKKNPWRMEETNKTFSAFNGMNQYNHGISWVPSNINQSRVFAATSTLVRNPESVMVRFWDTFNNRELASWRTASTRYERSKPQAVTFIDKFNMLVVFQFAKISFNTNPERNPCPKNEEAHKYTSSFLVHFRLQFDVDNGGVLNSKSPLDNSHFREMQSLELMGVNAEDLKYRDGVVVISDQFGDYVHFVALDPLAQTPPRILNSYTGYHMSHGVSFSKYEENVLGVAHYGDNSIVIQEIPGKVRKYMKEWRAKHSP